MIKKTAIVIVELIALLSLGIILLIQITGGFSFTLGPLGVKAHHFKNLLIFLVSALLLRKFLTGSFFKEFICFAPIRHWTAKLPLKTITQRILLVGFSFLLCFLLCFLVLELVLKTGWFDDKGVIWFPEKYKIINYNINQENQHFAEKNPYHFTDKVRDKRKPDGYYRIAVLGDSFVWSDGLPYEQAWNHKLEQKITQHYDHVEVMSWGLPGWSTLDEFRFLKKHGVQYHIDLLIIEFVINDPDMGHYKRKDLNWHKSSGWYVRIFFNPLQRFFPNAFDFVMSHVNTFLTDFVLEGYGYKYWHEQLYSQENLQRYVELLTEIANYCKSHNIRLLFVLTPNTYEKINQKRFEAIIPLLQRAGIEYLNLYPAVFRELHQYKPRELWANLVNPHPGPLVTEVYANEVFQYLQQNGALSAQ